jgi:hypothetical protein
VLCVGDCMAGYLVYDRAVKLITANYFGLDNLNTCKENEMCVDIVIDFQFFET